MDTLMRHIRACRNAVLPGRHRRLFLGDAAVGWVTPEMANTVTALGAVPTPDGIRLPDATALRDVGEGLVRQGRTRWRDEAFDVRAEPGGEVVAQVDRGVLPLLGIRADGAHLNGLVRRADGLHLWVARRAADKALDPGKLDHLAAGGVPAGLTPEETLHKEAAEEAGIPPELAAAARPVATIAYAMERPEGLRRDRLFCYDLDLPESFVPVATDGEVAGFELWPLPRVLDAVRVTDAFKFNVPLVLIDLFLRTGLVDPQGAEGRRLRAALERDRFWRNRQEA